MIATAFRSIGDTNLAELQARDLAPFTVDM